MKMHRVAGMVNSGNTYKAGANEVNLFPGIQSGSNDKQVSQVVFNPVYSLGPRNRKTYE